MILIGGHKDLKKKKLMKIAAFMPITIIDGTPSSEDLLHSLSREQENGFVPPGQAWISDEERLRFTEVTTKRKEREKYMAIENWISGVDFHHAMLRTLVRYLKAKGNINVIIIMQQEAADALAKKVKEAFVDYCGSDYNVIMTYDEIRDDWEQALQYVPDGSTLKALKKGCAKIDAENKDAPSKKLLHSYETPDDEDYSDLLDEDRHKDNRRKRKKKFQAELQEAAALEKALFKTDYSVFEAIEQYFGPNAPQYTEDLVLDRHDRKKKKKKHHAEDDFEIPPWMTLGGGQSKDSETSETKKKKDKGLYDFKII